MSFSDIMIYDLQTKRYRNTSGSYIVYRSGSYNLPLNTEAIILRFMPGLNGTVRFGIEHQHQVVGRTIQYKLLCDNNVVASGTLSNREDLSIVQNVSAGHTYEITFKCNAEVTVLRAVVEGEIVPNYEHYHSADSCFG